MGGGDGMATLIRIEQITVYGFHGALPEERVLGQRFQIDLQLEIEGPVPGDDSLENTVDYRQAVEIARRVVEGPPRHLLETLAEQIAGELLRLPGVNAVKVCLRKPHPPIPAVEGGVAVEISRGREPG